MLAGGGRGVCPPQPHEQNGKTKRVLGGGVRPQPSKGPCRQSTALGCILLEGQGVAKNKAGTVKLYRKDPRKGTPIPCVLCILGGMLLHSRDLAMNEAEEEAAKWCRKAAEQGFSKAQCNLGKMLAHGVDVAKNETEAATWLRKAAAQGLPQAQSLLKELLGSA